MLKELAAREAFRNVVAKPIDEGNLVGISGDVIGKSRMDEISELGRQHGLFTFADRENGQPQRCPSLGFGSAGRPCS